MQRLRADRLLRVHLPFSSHMLRWYLLPDHATLPTRNQPNMRGQVFFRHYVLRWHGVGLRLLHIRPEVLRFFGLSGNTDH
jgi:hypothetical protein